MRLRSLALCFGLVACGGKAVSHADDDVAPGASGGNGVGGAGVHAGTGGMPGTGGVVSPTGGTVSTGGGNAGGAHGAPLCEGGWPYETPCSLELVGVNLAGAEFGEGEQIPGHFGEDYIYPDAVDVDYFAARGMNTVRLPFRWERLQTSPSGAFDATELERIKAFVAVAHARGMTVILDPHNYARYRLNGALQRIGDGVITTLHFQDFWSKLATELKGQSALIFGLMNEPWGFPTEEWVTQANEAIAAIRKSGAHQPILVPGMAWTGAHSWHQSWYGTPNAIAMLDIVDPDDNYAFEVHQYFDDDHSGGSQSCSHTDGEAVFAELTAWLRMHGKRAFLGEFGGGTGADCEQAITSTLSHLEQNADVWMGWTYWAGGPWWPGDYFTSITPTPAGQDKPQMLWLMDHTHPF